MDRTAAIVPPFLLRAQGAWLSSKSPGSAFALKSNLDEEADGGRLGMAVALGPDIDRLAEVKRQPERDKRFVSRRTPDFFGKTLARHATPARDSRHSTPGWRAKKIQIPNLAWGRLGDQRGETLVFDALTGVLHINGKSHPAACRNTHPAPRMANGLNAGRPAFLDGRNFPLRKR